MSRSIQISLTKIKNILSNGKVLIAQIPNIGFGGILSVTELRIPSVAELSPGIPYPMATDSAFNYLEKSKVTTQRPMLTAGKASTDLQDDFSSDYHLAILEVLKETGYSVKEVKALASGEKVITITIADILGASKQESSYEFAYRRSCV